MNVFFSFPHVSFAIRPKIKHDTPKDPHVSKIDNDTYCSSSNIDNSDEEIELPNDILEALEKQDEGSKPNIEELEIVNLVEKGEDQREVKIGNQKFGIEIRNLCNNSKYIHPRFCPPFLKTVKTKTTLDWATTMIINITHLSLSLL